MNVRLAGDIERRLLINYAVDPDVAARLLPEPFRPQLVRGYAVAGICLIRLAGMRPLGMPRWLGVRSENAAHRIAVEWDANGAVRRGVYIPRRDSNSWLNVAVGGRLYPGAHERAHFAVDESPTRLRVAFASVDGTAAVDVDVDVAQELTASVLFADLAEASSFFEQGADGYSATRGGRQSDGLGLRTTAWRAAAGHVNAARSTFFDDDRRFPPGTSRLDCALVMRDVPVAWQPLPSLGSQSALST